MFDIDRDGLRELEGGRDPSRLAFEPIANVFDEYREYGPDAERKRPTFCAVTLEFSSNPRGVWFTVTDDGPGFANERDIWTLYGRTAKRSAPQVGGRFNCGEKQLIAAARQATVKTNSTTVEFDDGRRNVVRHRTPVASGTVITALMPWTRDQLGAVRSALLSCVAPEGLHYTVDGALVKRPLCKARVTARLPTVDLVNGVLSRTSRTTRVDVLNGVNSQWLFELGVPVCSLAEVGFPFGLDVQQKIPVPQSRDMVETTYLFRLIGTVLEQAAMDSVKLLSESDQQSGFVKDALDYIKEPEALRVVVESLYGDNVVRQSSDPIANAKAAAAGATVLPGRLFGDETRQRLTSSGIMPTALERFGGSERQPPGSQRSVCPQCKRPM